MHHSNGHLIGDGRDCIFNQFEEDGVADVLAFRCNLRICLGHCFPSFVETLVRLLDHDVPEGVDIRTPTWRYDRGGVILFNDERTAARSFCQVRSAEHQ